MTSRALVLAGGGVAGISWLLGMITALRDGGVELDTADVLIGTSAGSAVAAQLATGQLDAAARLQHEPSAELAVDVDFAAFLAAAVRATQGATSAQDAVRRIANLPSQVPPVDPAARAAAVAARLPVEAWPERPLRITAVAQDTGERIVFDRMSDISLATVVTASCAVPGIWPPVEIAGRSYVDGGAHSSTNADLAAGADRILVLVPTAVDERLGGLIDAEVDAVRPGRALVVSADDESLAAIGPNPLDPARRAAAFDAGRRQAARVGDEVREFWTS